MAASTPFQGVLRLVLDGASFAVVRELLDAGDLPAGGCTLDARRAPQAGRRT